MKKLSFVQKCVAKLNLTEDSKIELAADQIIKTYEKEIKVRERKIADIKVKEEEDLIDLNEQLEELRIEKAEVATTIDVDSINTNEARRNYVGVYTQKLQAAIDRVKAKETQIKEYKENVEDKIKVQQTDIDYFKALLAEME
jgi:ABC-type phosphate transport system auxiliary subunit